MLAEALIKHLNKNIDFIETATGSIPAASTKQHYHKAPGAILGAFFIA